MKKYSLIGNCTSGLEDEDFQDLIAQDATEMQQLIEESKRIDRKAFLSKLEPLSRSVEENRNLDIIEALEYGYNPKKAILWSYNKNEDIHRFYTKRS